MPGPHDPLVACLNQCPVVTGQNLVELRKRFRWCSTPWSLERVCMTRNLTAAVRIITHAMSSSMCFFAKVRSSLAGVLREFIPGGCENLACKG